MKYNQPYGVTDPDAPYINGNPSTGTMGSIPPAASIEYPQREIVEMIKDGGFNPDNGDLKQLSKAIQSCYINYVQDTGTVNALNVTMVPAPAYTDGLVVRVKVAVINTGASSINVNAQGAKLIRRKGDTDVQAGDLSAGSIAYLVYNTTLNGGLGAFELQGVGAGGGGSSTAPPTGPSGQLAANLDLYVHDAIGNDANDGTADNPAHALKTIQRAIDIAFGYMPSQYGITIHVAPGNYIGTAESANWSGPHLTITGTGGPSVTSFTVGNNTTDIGFLSDGPGNWMEVNGFTVNGSANPANHWPLFLAEISSYMHIDNCIIGAASMAAIRCSRSAYIQMGSNSYKGSVQWMFYNDGGNIVFEAPSVHTVLNALTVRDCWCWSSDCGVTEVQPPATYQNAGLVSGKKYNAMMNGCIDATTLGVNYFPGTVAGTLVTGGQYNP